MKTKILCLIMIGLFLGSTILPAISSISGNEVESLDESSCYGFIVPIVKLENKTLENDIDCRIHHMVNDFLREQITVYWTAENLTQTVLAISSTIEEEMVFSKGTFIIPFTENDTTDTKIIAIVCDYNQSSEIEEDETSIPVYQLIESLDIKAHELTELKLARYVGCRVHKTQFYLIIANQCGFLDFDIIPAKDIKEKLTNERFNIFIWEGGEPYMQGPRSYSFESQMEEIIYRVMPTIRKFVANGGGYASSCYGTYKSSILWFTPNHRLYYPTLGIAGTIVTTPKEQPEEYILCKQKVVAENHPVVYGMKSPITDFFSGPKLTIVGKNAEPIALFQDSIDSYDGSPSWVSNTYKNGKVVSFCSHPEIMAFLEEEFNGRQVISNTWFHLTNKGIFDIGCDNNVNLSAIRSIFEKTSNLVDNSIELPVLFDDVRNSINVSISKLNNLESKILEIRALVDEINTSEHAISNMYNTIKKIIGGKNTTDGVNLSTFYYEKISEILSSIEKIYPLLENDTNFTEKTQSLIEIIFSKINDINDLILKAQEDAEKAEKELDKYQNKNWFLPKIKEFYINEMLFRVREKISEVFVKISQTYHESLKFLRHNWYEYETSIIS